MIPGKKLTTRLDRILLHKVWGYVIFFIVLFLIFQSIFAWAKVPMDFIDNLFAQLSSYLISVLPSGPLTNLIGRRSDSRYWRHHDFHSTDCHFICIYLHSRRIRIYGSRCFYDGQSDAKVRTEWKKCSSTYVGCSLRDSRYHGNAND